MPAGQQSHNWSASSKTTSVRQFSCLIEESVLTLSFTEAAKLEVDVLKMELDVSEAANAAKDADLAQTQGIYSQSSIGNLSRSPFTPRVVYLHICAFSELPSPPRRPQPPGRYVNIPKNHFWPPSPYSISSLCFRRICADLLCSNATALRAVDRAKRCRS